MKRALLVLLVLGVAACASRSGSHRRPTEPWSIQDSAPPRWYAAMPGETYLPAWGYVLSCSRLPVLPGGDYGDVHWLVVSSGGLRDDKGRRIIGVWLAPDTIVLDSAWIQSSWLVAHELLHHLRQVAGEQDPHPHVPFTWPCLLMYFQNAPGGLMAREQELGAVGSPVRMPGIAGIQLLFVGEAVRRETAEP